MKQFLKFATVAVALFSLGFMAQSCSTAKALDNSQLEGYWALKTLKGEVAKDAFKGAIPSLEFDFDKNMVNGSAGCNRYFGQYTLESNVFNAPNLGSTMMICAEANKEDLFTETLAKKDLNVSLENGVLTFKDNATTVLEFQKGSAPKGMVDVSLQSLTGTWTLTKLQDKDIAKLFGDSPATLVIGKDGAISGNAGCNNYRSSVAVGDAAELTFAPLMSTKMACDRLEGEQTYTIALGEPLKAMINNDKLTLTKDGVIVLEFTQSQE